MKHLILAALLITPLPALAEDITVGVGTVSVTWTLSPDDQAKFDEWVQSAYQCNPATQTAQAAKTAPGQVKVPPPPTGPVAPGSARPLTLPPAPLTACTPLTLDESQALWAEATLQGTINNANRYHQQKAALDAANGVSPIAPVSVVKKGSDKK